MSHPTVQVALLFHCNQAISNFAQRATENCYRGLVRVLKRHPEAHLNFHWSGSLLTCLQWWCPELVDSIRRQIEKGRWEILASTYAQSVPFSSPASLNRLALRVHRAALRAAFPEAQPRGYWISERSWRPEMANQITEEGLDFTLIEDHILANAGCEDLSRPRRIATGSERDLVVFTDNEDFKHPINCAIWTGDSEPALDHLRRVRKTAEGSRDAAPPPIVTYGEDGEVCGLWPVERGCPPQIAWENLDRLLTALEREPGVELVCLSDYLDRWGSDIPREENCIGPGQAKWMCDSLADSHLPYHEPGYSDWFDFNRRAEKLKRFRPIFRRESSEVLGTKTRTPAQRRLLLQAALGVAAHTFEFGCIGIGHRRGQLWERCRVGRLPLALARGEGPRESGAIDLNGDRQREHALVSRDLLSLWSRRTGALLHLFDLPTGDEMVGNELAATSIFGLGFDEEQIPEVKPSALTWSGFRSGRQRLEDFEGLWREVPWHRSWLRYLIDWSEMRPKPTRIRQVMVNRKDFWSLENGTREKVGFPWPPPVRQRALVERLMVDGEVAVDVAEMSRTAGVPTRLRETADGFEITLARRPVELVKRVAQRGRTIRVDYRLINRSA
ncbi:hypothetical protein JXA47_14655, partial [Candidatus Sumerlaeota bacterium]|nr:hypothetical protein [Candidatus Sumerlaeota bacterium]